MSTTSPEAGWPHAPTSTARRTFDVSRVRVDWTEDPDSRVGILSTALGDLRGVARLALEAPMKWAFRRRGGGRGKSSSVVAERYVWT